LEVTVTQHDPDEQHDRHPHVHAVTHALATAGHVYADALASLVTSTHAPSWEEAVQDYDRRHPALHDDIEAER
jgi:hypothetical protein